MSRNAEQRTCRGTREDGERCRSNAVNKEALEATFPDGTPDWRTRILARTSLMAEAYGKPTQTVANEGVQEIAFRSEYVTRPRSGCRSSRAAETTRP